MYVKNSDLHNFTDGSTISCVSSSLNELIPELEKEGNTGTQCFWGNSMIANPKKLQAIITDRKNQKNYPQLTIDENVITSSENVTLLGLEVDSKRNFDEHISKLCNKNALCRIGNK